MVRVPEAANMNLFVNNSSVFLNSSKVKIYQFVPVAYSIKVVLASLSITAGFLGFIGSIFVLNFKRKDLQRNLWIIKKAFARSVTPYLIISLSVSDILTAAIGFPILAINILFDALQTQWTCKIVGTVYVFLVVITLNNLLLISIEQYCGVFHIYRIPSTNTVKKAILVIWIEAMLASLSTFIFVNSIRKDVNEDYYTLVCRYDLPALEIDLAYSILYLLVYFIPLCLSTYFATAITWYFYKKRKRTNSLPSVVRYQGICSTVNSRVFNSVFLTNSLWVHIPYIQTRCWFHCRFYHSLW